MKKKKGKGFTLVELVVIIAIIAVLATVLVPTFSDLIERSHRSNMLQKAKLSVQVAVYELNSRATTVTEFYVVTEKYIFIYTDHGGIDYEGAKLFDSHEEALAEAIKTCTMDGKLMCFCCPGATVPDGVTEKYEVADIVSDVLVFKGPESLKNK